MSLLQGLAHQLARPVAAHDRRRAARHLQYWIGSAALGAASEQGEALWRACGLAARPDETIDDASHAAHFYYEASLGSVYEMDDTHRAALVHPGPIVMPVARYLARLTQADPDRLLDAIVRGYEAMIRLGLAVGAAHYTLWHNTATCGNVGAAVTAASLLGLDTTRTTHAMALAVTRASGLWQIRLEPSDGKAWHTSQAAQTGVQAAWMAHAGLTGPAHALEGEKGMFAAMCADAQPENLLAPADAPWSIHHTSLKPWPACRHAHPAIAAAIALRESLPIGEIDRIAVDTYGDAQAFCDRTHPTTALQGRFSLQHLVATALLRGDVWLPDFSASALDDAACRALRTRIAIAIDPVITQRYPAHFGARVTITLADGRVFCETSADAPGDPEMPIDDEALRRLVDRMLHDAGWGDDLRHSTHTTTGSPIPLRTAYIMRLTGTAPRG